jgi:hypothetical protein
MRKNKTYETTHKSDDYHTRTPRTTRGQGKNTIIALGLLRELGQVDITLSFLLCSHAARFCSLVATRTRGRMQRRTLATKKRSIPLPRRCTNSANAGRATKRAQRKVQNGRQQSRSSSQCALCTSYRPTTLPPPAANRGQKNGALFRLTRVTLQLGSLSLSLIPSD